MVGYQFGQVFLWIVVVVWMQVLEVEIVVLGLCGCVEQVVLVVLDQFVQGQVFQVGVGDVGVDCVEVGVVMLIVVQVQVFG